MAITTIHNEYSSTSDLWQRVRDCVAGEDCIRQHGRKYLPSLIRVEKDYLNYLGRAIYINYTGRILNLSLGQMFRNAPQHNLPDYLADDIDLRGTNITNWSRFVASELMQTNRLGLWIDYSDTLGRPYISTYRAEEILNWHYGDSPDGLDALQFVILGGYINQVKDFEVKQAKTYTVLQLNEDGHYQVDRYETADNGKDLILASSIVPAVDGKPLTFIPFLIMDVSGDPEHCHHAPLLDICNLNLAHYRDSADHQTRLHMFALPTVVTKGWTNKEPFPLCGVADVGVGGNAMLLELSADNPLSDEMKRKEEAISMLGSSMLSGRGRYVSSAQTADIQQDGDNATLADIAVSMSEQVTKALRILSMWLSDQEITEDLSIQYNTIFEEPSLASNQLTELTSAVLSGLISYDTFYYQLNKYKFFAPGTDIETEKAAIKQTQIDLINNRGQIPGYNV